MDNRPAAQPPRFTKRDALISTAIFVAALSLFLHSRNSYVGDSKYSLLLTQSLLTKGSFALDNYTLPHLPARKIGNAVFDGDIYQIEMADGHLYYYFPPGTSILSAPFVLIANCFGYSIVGTHQTYSLEQEIKIQRAIASLLMAVAAVIFYFTARLLLPAGWSIAIALGRVYTT